jgi:hypothetical protein
MIDGCLIEMLAASQDGAGTLVSIRRQDPATKVTRPFIMVKTTGTV